MNKLPPWASEVTKSGGTIQAGVGFGIALGAGMMKMHSGTPDARLGRPLTLC